MGKLEIKKYPDPILRKKAREIKKVDDDIKKLADDIIETMYEGDGGGLAGPQVGVSKRIFVVDAGDGPRIFINPKIFSKKGRQVDCEGCLSFPGMSLDIKRAKELKCKFLDKEGREQEIKAEGLLARIIQHENDHLDGALIIDKVGPWKRRKVLKECGLINKPM